MGNSNVFNNMCLEGIDMSGDLEIDKRVMHKWFLIKRGVRLLLTFRVVKILSGVQFLMNTVLKLRFLYEGGGAFFEILSEMFLLKRILLLGGRRKRLVLKTGSSNLKSHSSAIRDPDIRLRALRTNLAGRK